MKDRTSRTHALIPAAGRGVRFDSGENKILKQLGGIPIVARTVMALGPLVDSVTVVGREEELPILREAINVAFGDNSVRYAVGGETRQDSVALGLAALADYAPDDIVLVHDAARPLVTPDIIQRCIESANLHGSGVAAIPVVDTLKLADNSGRVFGHAERTDLWAMQTPQAFRLGLLRHASRTAESEGFVGTDEVSLVQRVADKPINLVVGSRENVKVTTPADLDFAEAWLGKAKMPEFRVGTGYDIHQLVTGRKLWLGGVEIAHDKGLLGHSDADVLLHALCDALLGAAALPDIGHLYPNTDQRFAGAPSLAFVTDVAVRLAKLGWVVQNVDCTVIAEQPKIAKYAPQMRTLIAAELGVAENRVSIKATTQEGIGSLGAGEGIACHAIACIAR